MDGSYDEQTIKWKTSFGPYTFQWTLKSFCNQGKEMKLICVIKSSL